MRERGRASAIGDDGDHPAIGERLDGTAILAGGIIADVAEPARGGEGGYPSILLHGLEFHLSPVIDGREVNGVAFFGLGDDADAIAEPLEELGEAVAFEGFGRR